MKRIGLMLIIAVLMTSLALAGAGEAFEFGRTGTGPRQEALAGAVTALSGDWNNMFWNPAGLASINQYTVGFNTKLYGIARGSANSGVTYIAPSFIIPLDTGKGSSSRSRSRGGSSYNRYSFYYTDPMVTLVQYRRYNDDDDDWGRDSRDDRRGDDRSDDRRSGRSDDRYDDRRSDRGDDRYDDRRSSRSDDRYDDRDADRARYDDSSWDDEQDGRERGRGQYDDRRGDDYYSQSRNGYSGRGNDSYQSRSGRQRYTALKGKVLAGAMIVRSAKLSPITDKNNNGNLIESSANQMMFQASWGDTFRTLGVDTGRDELLYGATVKILTTKYNSSENAVNAAAFTSDIGAIYQFTDLRLNIGVMFRNLPLTKMKLYSDSPDKLPSEGRLGVSYDALPQTRNSEHRVQLFADAGKAAGDTAFGFAIGSEYTYDNMISARIGTNPLLQDKFNFGVGVEVSGVSINYAGKHYGVLGVNHSIGVKYSF